MIAAELRMPHRDHSEEEELEKAGQRAANTRAHQFQTRKAEMTKNQAIIDHRIDHHGSKTGYHRPFGQLKRSHETAQRDDTQLRP